MAKYSVELQTAVQNFNATYGVDLNLGSGLDYENEQAIKNHAEFMAIETELHDNADVMDEVNSKRRMSVVFASDKLQNELELSPVVEEEKKDLQKRLDI